MSTTDKITQPASPIFVSRQHTPIRSPQQAIVPAIRPLPGRPVSPSKTPIVINVPPVAAPEETATLSQFLRIGRQYHPICRGKFVDKVVLGFYRYERRIEYRTCAIAAAYAGAFGKKSVEDSNFSRSMASWKLKQRLGYDLENLKVQGPTGRNDSLANEIIGLTDIDGWNRRSIADWLESVGL